MKIFPSRGVVCVTILRSISLHKQYSFNLNIFIGHPNTIKNNNILLAAVYMVYTVGTFFVQNTSLIKIDKVN